MSAAVAELHERIEDARAATDTDPTEAQKRAGTYRKGKVRLHGLTITIENPKGSTRAGVDRDGKVWSSVLAADYGYVNGTTGADGDHVDVFLGPHPESELVFIIDQLSSDRSFDEHKCVIGCTNEREARELYLANYSSGWRGLGAITAMRIEEFRNWLDHHDTTQPVGLYVKADGSIEPGIMFLKARVLGYRKRTKTGKVVEVSGYERRDQAGGKQLLSPNTDENLSPRQAAARLRGRRQTAIAMFSDRVDKAFGISSATHPAIGDWTTGRENSMVIDFSASCRFEDAVASLALKCLRANQIAGAIFFPDESAAGCLYAFSTTSARKARIRELLDNAGIANRTFQVLPDGKVTVLVAHSTGEIDGLMLRIGSEVGADVERKTGRFQVIGDPEGGSRDVAARRYRAILQSWLQSQVHSDEASRRSVRRVHEVVVDLIGEAASKRFQKSRFEGWSALGWASPRAATSDRETLAKPALPAVHLDECGRITVEHWPEFRRPRRGRSSAQLAPATGHPQSKPIASEAIAQPSDIVGGVGEAAPGAVVRKLSWWRRLFRRT